MARSKATSQKKPVTIIYIIKTPIRVLCKAKDIYVKGISNFSNTYNRPVMIMEHANRATAMQLPRSFSTTTTEPIISMAAADLERCMTQNQNHQLQRKGVVPRSVSVGMGRIDEDRVASFRDDCILLKNKVVVKVRDSRLSSNLSYARS